MSENFSDLLNSSETTQKRLRFGMKIKAKVVGLDESSVFVDLGTKIDGYVDRADLSDEKGNLTVKIGDEIDLYVVSAKESEIKLSRALSGEGSVGAIREAFEKQVPVSGKVRAQKKGGFEVAIMGRKAFCPISHVDIKKVEKPEEYVGEVFNFMITAFEDNGRNIVVSRQPLLREERQKALGKLVEDLKTQETITGQVTKVTNFGAFVSVDGGLEGLIHVSELAWTRVEHASSVLKLGDVVTAKVLKVEPGEAGKPPRISLSLKQLTVHPWKNVEGKFKSGDKVTGTVTRCADFGAFVELVPGVEGLVHISELAADRRVKTVSEVVKPGDRVEALILSVDTEAKKISLSIKALTPRAEAPASEEERQPRRQAEGAEQRERPSGRRERPSDEDDWRRYAKVAQDESDGDDENPFKKAAKKLREKNS